MLIMGDFFDIQFGVAFGISTLAAAAMGNTVGDVCGIWLGGTVEALCERIGLPEHNMTRTQRLSNNAQLAKTVGSVFGILVGCVLGMFPLLWPDKWRLWDKK
eukprot:c13946_g1_i3.p3 GENE.c13946_g1_i3~~c13946_g1_i3.p3  ORF type:complete len:102 (+),score=28.19 c13946_g1_i3:399-704(+)